MSDQVHTLVGPYVLDAVDDLERAAFERHLRDCEACRAEVGELREAGARLADGAWSVPPPRLRESVRAEIRNTRQLGPPARVRAARRRWPVVAAAAAVLLAAGTGTAVYQVQDQRVRDERAAAVAARASEARVRAILTAPDLVVREEPLNSGGRVTVATSRLNDAGVIMLAAGAAPAGGRVYQLWTIRSGQDPASAGALGVGQSATVRIVEGLPGSSAVGVSVERAPSSVTPTTPLEALVKLT
ncbi:anti-sigma factor [Actinoplanes sp. NPDC048796]|uniref:anti-sigma factor n=1 Tax=unclassified Actinoplanes TaxID=2626549 RepID=UPI0033F07CF6